MANPLICRYCGPGERERFPDFNELAKHVEDNHPEVIPGNDWSHARVMYWLRTGRTAGSCCMCHNPTGFNEKTGKYFRFCTNPKCKEAYRKEFEKRMINKHGKTTLLNDPEQQRKMLANRKISGVYRWSDRIHSTPYVGSYEKAFLEFLDLNLQYSAEDIIAPSPHTYTYVLDGERHFYIPDFYIPTLNLELEIKDDDNTHPNRVGRDAFKEKEKDKLFKNPQCKVNYIKVKGKNHMVFLQFLELYKQKISDPTFKKNIVLL